MFIRYRVLRIFRQRGVYKVQWQIFWKFRYNSRKWAVHYNAPCSRANNFPLFMGQKIKLVCIVQDNRITCYFSAGFELVGWFSAPRGFCAISSSGFSAPRSGRSGLRARRTRPSSSPACALPLATSTPSRDGRHRPDSTGYSVSPGSARVRRFRLRWCGSQTP